MSTPPSPLTAATSPPFFSLPCITADQVRGQLKELRPKKAAGSSPRLLKSSTAELSEPIRRIFSLSIQLGRVPTLWTDRTSCISPIPKKNRPCELNDFRPVVLRSHQMKMFEGLFLSLLRLRVTHAQDRLQFVYGPGVGVEDAILVTPSSFASG